MDSTQQAIQRLEQKVDTAIILLAQLLKALEGDEPEGNDGERDPTQPL